MQIDTHSAQCSAVIAPYAGWADANSHFHANESGFNLHVHGMGMDVLGNAGMTATAIYVASDAEVHAHESSYFLPPKPGLVVRRIVDNGAHHIHAPFAWSQHPTAPVIDSLTGADTAVVTDTDDGRPHILIYDTTCPGKWLDTYAKVCHP